MKVLLKTSDAAGSFYIEEDGEQIAELEFTLVDGVLFANHTGVRKEYEGKGIAGLLFDEMIQYAQAKSYKISPVCPYIIIKFKRNPDKYQSLLLQE